MITFKEGNLRIPKWNRPVYMVAGGTTAYRKYFPEYKLEELVMMAVKQMLENNDLKMSPAEVKGLINYAVYGQFADHFQDQLLCEAKVHDYLGLEPLYNVGVKTGGATGGTSVLTGAMAVASGYADVCLVAGWERMDEVDTRTGNFYISTAACKDFETRLGRIYSSYYAPMANRFSEVYNVSEITRAKIAVKNRGYACSSPYAQQPGKHTVEEVLAGPMSAYPLRFLECCAMSVGSAAVLLCTEEMAHKLSDNPVELFIAGGSHTLRVADRRPMDIPLLPNEIPGQYDALLEGKPPLARIRKLPGGPVRRVPDLPHGGDQEPAGRTGPGGTARRFHHQRFADLRRHRPAALRAGSGLHRVRRRLLRRQMPVQPLRRPFWHHARGGRHGDFPVGRVLVAAPAEVRQVPRRSKNLGKMGQNQTRRLGEFAGSGHEQTGVVGVPRGCRVPRYRGCTAEVMVGKGKESVMSDTRKIQYIGSGAPIRQHVPQMVVDFPRSMVHHHTYGLLSPFFVGLREGKLMATRCTNPACPENRLWVPPRADCPDCYERMVWEEIPQPVMGKIYAYTQVVYAGVGMELTTRTGRSTWKSRDSPPSPRAT